MPIAKPVMSYPCFFLLTPDSRDPEFIRSGCHRCLCLFTNRRLAEGFHRDKYGVNHRLTELELMEFETRTVLATFLQEVQPELAQYGVLHLAIDATPGERVIRVLLSRFIDSLVSGCHLSQSK